MYWSQAYQLNTGSRRIRPRVLYAPDYTERASGCGCHAKNGSNQLEQKIKDNPLLFVFGALAIGYLIAKR